MSKFITFEGGEGSGKTTQIARLARALKQAKHSVTVTREPGGTVGAEQIRDLLLQGQAHRWDRNTETLLFYAARLDHVNKVIKPALQKDHVVLCDRFADSTRVYQGYAAGEGFDAVDALHRLTLGDFKPNLTFVLDIDPATGLARAKSRKGRETRFEEMDLTFHQKVRQGFLEIARLEPKRCVVLDAAQTIASLHAQIIASVGKRLGLALHEVAA